MRVLTVEQLSPFTQSFPSRRENFPLPLPVSSLTLAATRGRIRSRQAVKLLAQVDEDSQITTSNTNQQLNLSVLRFTFGIPWLDESYLPRWMGYGFGSLILLNHFVGTNSPVTSAQLISEAVGLSLAAFSATLPYLGKFLQGASPGEQVTLPEGAEQIFVMSENVSDKLREDMAWATYALLRNTNSVSVLIYVQDVLCIRGYWSTPDAISRTSLIDWFKRGIEKFGLSDLNDSLYFTQRPDQDSGLEKLLPKGIATVLIQPVLLGSKPMPNENGRAVGFLLLASSLSYAYSDKDRSWIRAIANKFKSAKCDTL
ncbi:hypothetical protein Dimus_028272 [Dionaea muscipula]